MVRQRMSLCSRRRNPLSATASPRCFDLCCVNAQHLAFRLFGTLLGAGELRTDRPSELGKRATAGVRAAGFASGFDLLVRSHVGLRCLRAQLGSGNLPLVPLGEFLSIDQQYNTAVSAGVCRLFPAEVLRLGCPHRGFILAGGS